jgi:hypothetical protein
MMYMVHMVLINDRPFQMRASAAFLERIDNWRRVQPDLPSRAEAIRRLVEIALEASATAKGRGKR